MLFYDDHIFYRSSTLAPHDSQLELINHLCRSSNYAMGFLPVAVVVEHADDTPPVQTMLPTLIPLSFLIIPAPITIVFSILAGIDLFKY